tara:strand:+ start:4415 stop:5005 length:591 start_codon:yes stop_codon:yes gene_type:complete
MIINNINSKRKLTIFGHGWEIGKISLAYICRHSCTSAILDEVDFEWEEENLRFYNSYLSFSNSLIFILKNLDTNQEEKYEFKNLKKLGIYKGELNPEDLILTNSFLRVPKSKPINHIEHENEDYFLDCQISWDGIYGEIIFDKGKLFEFEKIKISVDKLDVGYEFYEWVCKIKYDGNNFNIGKKVNRKKTTKLNVY